MGPALEGVVQLDRSGQPPRVVLDTRPIQVLDVPWRDILGCWLVRVRVDPIAHRQAETFEALAVVHRGLFFRIPGEDTFWPTAERYGLALESIAAVAQREQRQATQQLKFELANPGDATQHGTKLRRRRKGHR